MSVMVVSQDFPIARTDEERPGEGRWALVGLFSGADEGRRDVRNLIFKIRPVMLVDVTAKAVAHRE